MNGALIGALLVTCVITAGTPGPNNFIVLTARLSDTTAAALRVYLGVCLGFPAMVFVVSLAVAHYGEAIIDQLTIIKYLGIGFLLYLAIKLFLAAQATCPGGPAPRRASSSRSCSNGQIQRPGRWRQAPLSSPGPSCSSCQR